MNAKANHEVQLSRQLTIPHELYVRLSAQQRKALQDCWGKNFVTPFIIKKLADELSAVVPQLLQLLNSSISEINKLSDEYGLAFAFLKRSQGTEGLVEAFTATMLQLEHELHFYSDPPKKPSILKTMRGGTKGNRAQVEFNQFVYEIAEILKSPKGIPWDDVADIIHTQAAADYRLREYIGTHKSESTKDLLRHRWRRYSMDRSGVRKSHHRSKDVSLPNGNGIE